MQLILATKNRGKVVEIEKILGHQEGDPMGSPLQIQSLHDFPNIPDVVEDGNTFQENALKKAREISRYCRGVWRYAPILADDSGIVVPALDGAPGIYSARYAGPGASDEDNLQKLITEIQQVPPNERQAHYVCVMALVLPDGREFITEGRCEGEIILEKRGTGGFGYDPIFYLPELGKTMAEISPHVKNQISHRGKALTQMVKILQHVLRAESAAPLKSKKFHLISG